MVNFKDLSYPFREALSHKNVLKNQFFGHNIDYMDIQAISYHIATGNICYPTHYKEVHRCSRLEKRL